MPRAATGLCSVKSASWARANRHMKAVKLRVTVNASTTKTNPTTLLAAHIALAWRRVGPIRSRSRPPARLPTTPARKCVSSEIIIQLRIQISRT